MIFRIKKNRKHLIKTIVYIFMIGKCFSTFKLICHIDLTKNIKCIYIFECTCFLDLAV